MFHTIINYITPYLTAKNAYHAAAFFLTAAGSQYAVQVVKLIAKNKLGKNMLRTLNGTFNTLFVAAGAIATGGISLGNLTVTAAALSTLSAWIFRIHNSYLYTTAETIVDKTLDETVPVSTAAAKVPKSSIQVSPSQLAG